MKFDIWVLFQKLSRKIHVSLKSDMNNGYFTWRPLGTFNHISLSYSQNEQDRQCTYNVIFRRVPATIVALEKKWVLQNLCVHLKTSISSMQCACAILSSVACSSSSSFSSTTLCEFWLAQLFLSIASSPVSFVSNCSLPSSSNHSSHRLPILLLAFCGLLSSTKFFHIIS